MRVWETTARRAIALLSLGAVAGLTVPVSAVPIAQDSFDYSAGDVTAAGGSGWASGSTWGATAVSETGGLTYTDLPTSGNVVFQATSNGGSGAGFRAIDTAAGSPAALAGVVTGGKLGVDDTTVWVSFLGRGSNTSWYTLSLYDGTNERRAVLHDGGSGNPGIYRAVGNNTTVNSSTTAFALARIEFKPGNDTISMWLNPAIGSGEAGLGTPFTATGDFTFDRFGIRRNTDSQTFQADELRVGTTFADVVPEPASAALIGLAGAGLLARRRRHA